MRFRAPRTAYLITGIALVTACGGNDSSSGPDSVPTSIEIVTSAAAVSPAGLALSQNPAFVVKNQSGGNIAGLPVSVAVTAGGGTITGAPTQTTAGPTGIGIWTMGPSIAANVVTITVDGIAPKTITVNTVAGPVASITAVEGNGQVQFAGRALAQPVRFAVRDAFGNPVAGQSLTFNALGEGTLSGTAAPSGTDGRVQAPTWTLGKRALPQQLRASTGAIEGLATATVRTSYNIAVEFFGTAMSSAMQEAFNRAAARISAMVVGDLPDVNVNGVNAADYCGEPALPVMSGTVDDVVIYAGLQNIDGPGTVLAQAGPCAVRDDASSLPVLGIMMFDAADAASLVASGNMEEVIMHEMMHVLGFGDYYWGFLGYLTGAGTSDPVYTGGNAIADCRLVGGASICASTVPIHNMDGPGSADSHWRESTFRNELMTAGLNAGSNPVSRMTIGGFMDLGYEVNYDAADSYRIPGTAASLGVSLSISAAPSVTRAGWERPRRARVKISSNGRVRPVGDAP